MVLRVPAGPYGWKGPLDVARAAGSQVPAYWSRVSCKPVGSPVQLDLHCETERSPGRGKAAMKRRTWLVHAHGGREGHVRYQARADDDDDQKSPSRCLSLPNHLLRIARVRSRHNGFAHVEANLNRRP